MLFRSNTTYSFENKVKEKQQYSPRSRSHESYLSILSCLLGKAAYFTITVFDGTSNLQKRIEPFLIEKRTNQYGGEVFVHSYTKEVMEILAEAENFRSHEDNVEFSFTREDDTWLLEAVPHHNSFSINAEYFTDIDKTFIEEEKRIAETPTRIPMYSMQWGVPYLLGKEDKWEEVLQILYWTSDSIQIGESEPVEFTEDVYEKISKYKDQYAVENLRTFRDGYLLFFSDAKERRSLLDRSFVSKLENYREPFRKIQFEKIMEQFKPGAKTEKKSDVWIPVRVDDK